MKVSGIEGIYQGFNQMVEAEFNLSISEIHMVLKEFQSCVETLRKMNECLEELTEFFSGYEAGSRLEDEMEDDDEMFEEND